MALVLAGCVAIRQPRVPDLPRDATPIPVTIGICPSAAGATRWLTREPLFASVVTMAAEGGQPTPSLVVVSATARYDSGYFDARRAGTRITEVFSIVSLGVLPTYIAHHGTAGIAIQRPLSSEAPCGPAPSGTPTVNVQARVVVREFLAFWVFVPAMIAALPSWRLEGGDGVSPTVVDPGDWLSAAIRARRAEIVRLAQP